MFIKNVEMFKKLGVKNVLPRQLVACQAKYAKPIHIGHTCTLVPPARLSCTTQSSSNVLSQMDTRQIAGKRIGSLTLLAQQSALERLAF